MHSLKSRVNRLEIQTAADVVHIMARDGVIYHTGHMRYVGMIGKTIDQMEAAYPNDNLNFINYIIIPKVT